MTNLYNLLNEISEIVFVTDLETDELLFINKGVKELCGDCLGKKCHEIFCKSDYSCKNCSKTDLSEDSFCQRITSNEINGKIFHLCDKIISWDGKRARLTVSSGTLQQNELEYRLTREHFLMSCIIELHKSSNTDIAIDGLLSTIGKFFEADRAFIFRLDEDTTSNTHEWCREGVVPQIKELQNLNLSLINRWFDTFNKGHCLITEDVEQIKDISPNEYKCLVSQNITRLMVAPLDDKDKLIGFMGIDNPSIKKATENQMVFEALSYFVSSVLLRNINENILQKLSFTDTLTKLFNRNKFIEDVKLISKNENGGIGVLYMDLNGLKSINDKFGHNTGDNALQTVAAELVKIFGKNRSYRVGGDEFVAICRNISESDFINLVETLKSNMDKIEYNSAIGYQYANNCEDINNIIKIADENMYLDKKYFYRNQKDATRYRFRNDTFTAISTPELLKNLINEERFVIWFQPRFNTHTREYCGCEALIRFFDDDEVLVSPMDFVPEMEENHTIHLIDFYVFRHVCEYLSGWIKNGKEVKPVSVNMSHQTLLHPGAIENIMNIWYDYNIPKDLIVIEVSENPDQNGIADIIEVLSDLKKRGFKIAIDNFGAKYADLYLFADLKFDILKLDGDLVYKIETDDKTRLLASSIANICHNENIKIVAEGVENEDELQLLIDMGCDEAQGYLFDKPMSWNWFEKKYLE